MRFNFLIIEIGIVRPIEMLSSSSLAVELFVRPNRMAFASPKNRRVLGEISRATCYTLQLGFPKEPTLDD
jgi:hypothetical protein